ncbi:ubiquitin carboxyl-terminal hydrolase 12-like protein, partial [Trifolium pratense]
EFAEMESEVSNTEIFEKFTWKIENFSRLNVDKMYSEPFILGGYPWKILLFPKGIKKVEDDHLSIYLEAMQSARYQHDKFEKHKGGHRKHKGY